MMNYKEAIEFIESTSWKGSMLGLERMRKLMELLGDPQKGMRFVHVAGTNGKGSPCRYLYCMLLEAGYHVGLYTSPYLERFTERIEYDGAVQLFLQFAQRYVQVMLVLFCGLVFRILL